MGNIVIRYSKAGIMQYANFSTTEDNQCITSNGFTCRYIKPMDSNYPEFEIGESVQTVLAKLRKFSYDKKAEIWSLNDVLFNVQSVYENYLKDIKIILTKYFNEQIRPLVPKTIHIKFNELELNKKPFRDIKKYQDVYNKANKLSYDILYRLSIVKYYDFKPENEWTTDYIDLLLRHYNSKL